MKKNFVLDFGICDLAVIPLRAEPSDKSEMVSQLLFGEPFEVLQQNNQWLRIHTWQDNYDGWIDQKQAQPLTRKSYSDLTSVVPVSTLDQVTTVTRDSVSQQLLIGSSLPHYDEGTFRINNDLYKITSGEVTSSNEEIAMQQIPELAKRFLNTPYLWGGRSAFGLDCSGFIHLVFKLRGIRLNRDAWQQSEQGILISFLDESRPGDVAFFQNEEGKIIHAGIILEENKIIHASGKVRIDMIDHFGIINEEQRRYTHQLRLIKRMIQ